VRDLAKSLEELEYLIADSGGSGRRSLYRLSDGMNEDSHILKGLTKPEELEEYMTSTG
jgi:hypothetical protein